MLVDEEAEALEDPACMFRHGELGSGLQERRRK